MDDLARNLSLALDEFHLDDANLGDLQLHEVDLGVGSGGLESLTSGHGMVEVGASFGDTACCSCCLVCCCCCA